MRNNTTIFCALLGVFVAGAAQAREPRVLYSFPNTYPDPSGGLVAGTGANAGLLYGATEVGGADRCGEIYQFNPADKSERTIYSFRSAPFSYDCSHNTDGWKPVGDLITVGGLIYGATSIGGLQGAGTLFSINPLTNTLQVLYTFTGGTDGAYPDAGLLNVAGVLYGITGRGGQSGGGTVFSFDIAARKEATICAFAANYGDGYSASGPLIAANGLLYGAAPFGGTGAGTVFVVDTAAGSERALYTFQGSNNPHDGANPWGGLVNLFGQLYGTTQFGGVYNNGTVFRVNASSGAESIAYHFGYNSANLIGRNPTSTLTYRNGRFYGATTYGGRSGWGTEFMMNLTTGDVHVTGISTRFQSLVSRFTFFNNKLYGVSDAGGVHYSGAIFNLTP